VCSLSVGGLAVGATPAPNHDVFIDTDEALFTCWADQWKPDVPSKASQATVRKHVALTRSNCARQISAVKSALRRDYAKNGYHGAALDQVVDRRVTAYLDSAFDEFWGEE
jgi:hypothetical protein